MPSEPDANLPFRWDLVRPDVLGSLLNGCAEPRLPPVDELVTCAAKVLARSGGGRMLFVGRSADSVFDFLSGVLAGTDRSDRIARLPYSYRAEVEDLGPADVARARAILTACDLTPARLTRGREPVALVDLVAAGHTFTGLYRLLRTWSDEDNEAWATARRKLRFVGITWRTETSPKTWRWQQHTDWAHELPAGAVVNVSLAGSVWGYWGNWQDKLTRSFDQDRWATAEAEGPRRDDRARTALAEAVALVEYGRTREARQAVRRVLAREPTMSEPWLRDLVLQLRRNPSPARI